jgi:DNA primase
MAAAEEIDVAGRAVRVTSSEREIFPAHRGAPAVSKLQVVQYYASVGEAFLRSLYERPVTLERWPKGVFEGAILATRTDSHGDAFFQKRIPKGAPDWVETARGVPHGACGRLLGSADGHHHLSSLAGAPR